MAKFYPSKLSEVEREELFIRFCQALAQLKNPTEAAQFLKDLLSVSEVEMLAKRLKAAELLIEGMTYSQISGELKIGSNTIARVHEWLKLSGDGYRLIVERLPKEKIVIKNHDPWRDIKRKYPVYFWPQILLKNLIKSSNESEKRKFREILSKMNKKEALYRQLSTILNKK